MNARGALAPPSALKSKPRYYPPPPPHHPTPDLASVSLDECTRRSRSIRSKSKPAIHPTTRPRLRLRSIANVMASSLFTSSFIGPPRAPASRPVRPPSREAHRRLSVPFVESGISLGTLHLRATPSPLDVPIGDAPLFLLVAVILAFSAQSWINSLLGGDQGLGAFLSDGGGFNKSGFKPRRRPIADERNVPGDTTQPLGGPDPLPWLKLPELVFVDVAGQPKKRKQMQQLMEEAPLSSNERDESEVVQQLESLREQMKTAVDQGDLEAAKRYENELQKVMREEGFDFSAS